jgi:predicted RNase H-like HicB family nuclease
MIPLHRFLIVIEKAGKNYSAYSPDLPGCIATGKTREEAEERMHEAIEMHIRGLVKNTDYRFRNHIPLHPLL